MKSTHKYYNCNNDNLPLELTREEESALKGEQGETMQMAYRILVATGEATDAEKLIPIEWAHLSGVNYNTMPLTNVIAWNR